MMLFPQLLIVVTAAVSVMVDADHSNHVVPSFTHPLNAASKNSMDSNALPSFAEDKHAAWPKYGAGPVPTIVAVVGNKKQNIGSIYSPNPYDNIVTALNVLCSRAIDSEISCDTKRHYVIPNIDYKNKEGKRITTGFLKIAVEEAEWPLGSNDQLIDVTIGTIAGIFQEEASRAFDEHHCEVCADAAELRDCRLCRFWFMSIGDLVSVRVIRSGFGLVRLDVRIAFHEDIKEIVTTAVDKPNIAESLECMPLVDFTFHFLKTNLVAFRGVFGLRLADGEVGIEARCTDPEVVDSM